MSLKYLTSIAAKGDTDIHKLIGDFADMSKDKIREEAEKLTAAREGQDEARRIDQGLAQAKLDEHHREGMEVVIDHEKAERKEVKKMLKAVEKKKAIWHEVVIEARAEALQQVEELVQSRAAQPRAWWFLGVGWHDGRQRRRHEDPGERDFLPEEGF